MFVLPVGETKYHLVNAIPVFADFKIKLRQDVVHVKQEFKRTLPVSYLVILFWSLFTFTASTATGGRYHEFLVDIFRNFFRYIVL
jgi:hypothetical protein